MRRVGNLRTEASKGWCEPCGEQFLKRASEMERLLPVKSVIYQSGEKSQLEWYHGEVVSNRDEFRLFFAINRSSLSAWEGINGYLFSEEGCRLGVQGRIHYYRRNE